MLLCGPHPLLGLVRRPKKEKGRVGDRQLPGAGGTPASPPSPSIPEAVRAAFKALAIIPSINTACEQRGGETQAGEINPRVGLRKSLPLTVSPPPPAHPGSEIIIVLPPPPPLNPFPAAAGSMFEQPLCCK